MVKDLDFASACVAQAPINNRRIREMMAKFFILIPPLDFLYNKKPIRKNGFNFDGTAFAVTAARLPYPYILQGVRFVALRPTLSK